jgi:hypothetical protein
MKAISATFPAAVLIERDWNKYNTTTWLKGSVSRSPVISTLASEADIIFSPSTGGLITSLTKISQKPLPGHKGKSEIRDKITAVARRFERLIIFVTEGAMEETTSGFRPADSMALAEFSGFCASLDVAANVLFVPGGGATLGKWIASAMVQYGITGDGNVGLLEEETMWELFLRRCGMNAYAAQAVISALKVPEDVEQNFNSVTWSAIATFVVMGHDERLMRLEAILGGSKVLEHVSRVVDAVWSQSAHLGSSQGR